MSLVKNVVWLALTPKNKNAERRPRALGGVTTLCRSAADAAEGAAAAPALSAESMYQEAGGACGEGYELVVKKVLGASCVCVADSCAEGGEGAREGARTEEERSFGKDKSPDTPVGDSGIKFTFVLKSE